MGNSNCCVRPLKDTEYEKKDLRFDYRESQNNDHEVSHGNEIQDIDQNDDYHGGHYQEKRAMAPRGNGLILPNGPQFPHGPNQPSNIHGGLQGASGSFQNQGDNAGTPDPFFVRGSHQSYHGSYQGSLPTNNMRRSTNSNQVFNDNFLRIPEYMDYDDLNQIVAGEFH